MSGSPPGSKEGFTSAAVPELGLNVLRTFEYASGRFLHAAQGQLVNFEGDCIVNSANSKRLGGGGIDKAVMAAGGQALLASRKAAGMVGVGPKAVYCATGDAMITSAPRGKTFGSLKARHVVHAVAPQFPSAELAKRDRQSVETAYGLLANAYRRALEVGAHAGARTIAVPMLATSNFKGGQSVEDIGAAGVSAVLETLTASPAGNTLDCVYLVMLLSDEAETMARVAEEAVAQRARSSTADVDEAEANTRTGGDGASPLATEAGSSTDPGVAVGDAAAREANPMGSDG